jgi:type IV secretory pathway protease TraF
MSFSIVKRPLTNVNGLKPIEPPKKALFAATQRSPRKTVLKVEKPKLKNMAEINNETRKTANKTKDTNDEQMASDLTYDPEGRLIPLVAEPYLAPGLQ